MNLLQRLEYWGDRHHPKWLDILRIALGIFLIYKGFEFLTNLSQMMSLMDRLVPFGSFALLLLGHFIVFAHIAGGFLIAMGMATRLACLIQIPILIGAIVFIGASPEIMKPFSELLLAVIVLLLLICFAIIGNGPWSFEWFVKRDRGE